MRADVAVHWVAEPRFRPLGLDIGVRVAAAEVPPDRIEADATGPDAARRFEDFYRHHYQSLVRLGFLLTFSEEVARDLVHDAFVRSYGRFDSLADPLPYLRRCVVNASRSWHRRRHMERIRSGSERVPDVELEADELFDVLARLPARQRAAIVLRFYEQMRDDEIARVLHCRPGTVASLVHRGCARLRVVMTEPDDRAEHAEPTAATDRGEGP